MLKTFFAYIMFCHGCINDVTGSLILCLFTSITKSVCKSEINNKKEKNEKHPNKTKTGEKS